MVPEAQRWLFWEADLARLDADEHADYVLARVLERGRLEDVRWAASHYGVERIRELFETRAHPEITTRTRRLWQAFFEVEEDAWPKRAPFRNNSSAPWID